MPLKPRDWSLLDRDTPPCWVPLVRDLKEIDIILLWFDDLIIFCEEKEIVDAFRTHVMARSARCKAPFKCEKNEDGEWKTTNPVIGEPEPEHPLNSAVFLGLFFMFSEIVGYTRPGLERSDRKLCANRYGTGHSAPACTAKCARAAGHPPHTHRFSQHRKDFKVVMEQNRPCTKKSTHPARLPPKHSIIFIF